MLEETMKKAKQALENIKVQESAINRHKAMMANREYSDNFYYTSGRKRVDEEKLESLQARLFELEKEYKEIIRNA